MRENRGSLASWCQTMQSPQGRARAITASSHAGTASQRLALRQWRCVRVPWRTSASVARGGCMEVRVSLHGVTGSAAIPLQVLPLICVCRCEGKGQQLLWPKVNSVLPIGRALEMPWVWLAFCSSLSPSSGWTMSHGL